MRKISFFIAAFMFLLGVSTVRAAQKAKSSAAKPATVKAAKITPAKKTVVKQQQLDPAKQIVKTPKYDFFQLGFWFNAPSSMMDTECYGMRLGAPFCGGPAKVVGIETAVFCGASDDIEGLQACILVAKSKRVKGIQFSIVNFCEEEVDGVQLGVLNMCEGKTFQLGILNYIKGNTFPWMPFVNFRF